MGEGIQVQRLIFGPAYS